MLFRAHEHLKIYLFIHQYTTAKIAAASKIPINSPFFLRLTNY